MAETDNPAKPRLPLHEYTIGWISALPIELAAAAELLDDEHESPPPQDNNPTLYTLGCMKGHNVVIACLPAGLIGTSSAARVAQGIIDRFPNVRIGLMVGIGGGVPSDNMDIRLGDVVVSQPGSGDGGVLQYDMGERLPNGRFQQTSHLDKPPVLLLSALSQVRSNHLRGRSMFPQSISQLQKLSNFSRDEAGPDRLFESTYQHKKGPSCAACDPESLIERESRSTAKLVQIHYGTIASGNTLMKDGVERDRTRDELGGNILCFEMEAAGLMNGFPCLVIRGICDYADSHKNKRWQPFAAATAAAYAKEILSVIPPKDVAHLAPVKAPWLVPFNRNPQFTGRNDILEKLHAGLEDPERHSRMVVHGLGGSGKSAVAIEFAYQTRDRDAGCAVFWVSAFSVERFKDSYCEIARCLEIPGAEDPQKSILEPVRRKLSGDDQRRWLMIVDNVDDKHVLFDVDGITHQRLIDYLPLARHGMVLITTRRYDVATRMATTITDVFTLTQLTPTEAIQFLTVALRPLLMSPDRDVVIAFLEKLTYLPLAIAQAVAYMNTNSTTLRKYIDIAHHDDAITNALSKDFEDQWRDRDSHSAVITTWYISFNQIRKDYPLAIKYLSYIACIASQDIPDPIFPWSSHSLDRQEAIGTLKGYDFLYEQKVPGYYDVHPLVHLVLRTWFKRDGRWNGLIRTTVQRLLEIVPYGDHQGWQVYVRIIPHAKEVMSFPENEEDEQTINLLDLVASCEHFLGQYIQAGTHLKRVWIWREKNHGPEHRDTLRSQNNLAVIYQKQGQWEEAEKLQIQIMEIEQRVLGPEHPNTLYSQNNLASIYLNQGRWEEAEKLQIQVIKTSQQVSGSEHPDTLASQNNLASIYRNQNRWDEAEKLQIQGMEIGKRVLGPEHPDVLICQSNLAINYWKQGRHQEALVLMRQCVEVSLRRLGEEHPESRHRVATLEILEEELKDSAV